MAGSIYDWSLTAGSNASADGDINWTEGQLPSTVNDSARVMMKRVAEWVKDHGALSLTGTDTLTVTANSSFTAYATGRMIIARVANDNTSTTVTLNVNSIGAKRVKVISRAGETDPAAGDLQAGMMAIFVYDAAANAAAGAWILANPANKQIGVDVQLYREELTKVNLAGTNIASAGSIDIGAGTGDFITITGTTTITALGTAAAGTQRILVFAGALTLTHNATSLILPRGANITTSAGDIAVMQSLGSGNWQCVSYEFADAADFRSNIGIRANSEKYCFRAHKNGTNQTAIVTGTPTLVTFGTEDFDIGSYYNTTNSRWTPPSGKYVINAYITQATANMVDNARIGVYIYKNGSAIQFAPEAVSGTAIVQGNGITGIVDADGDDYFEIYVTFSGTGDKTIDGTATQTFFSGWEV